MIESVADWTKNKTAGTPSKSGSKTTGIQSVADWSSSRTKSNGFNSNATPEIIQNSTSPDKLSGATTISAAPEKQWPGGFVGAAAKAAYDTTKNTIEGAANKINDFFGTLTAKGKESDVNALKDEQGNIDYTKTTGLTIGMTPEQREQYYEGLHKESQPLNKFAKGGSAVLGAANLAFLPVTAQIEAAKKVPLLKYPAEAGSFVFDKLGEAGKYTLGKAVDIAPVSQETKDTIKPFMSDLGAFAAQLAGVKLGFKLVEKGGSQFFEKLPIPEKVKNRVTSVVQHGVGLSMTPFSHIFGVASGMITQKITERQEAGVPITTDEARKIVDEVKAELPKETEGEQQTPPASAAPQPMSVEEWVKAGKPKSVIDKIETPKQDMRTVMENLSTGGYKTGDVAQIMKALFERNPSAKFSAQEVSEEAAKFKPIRPDIATTDENGAQVSTKDGKVVSVLKGVRETAPEEANLPIREAKSTQIKAEPMQKGDVPRETSVKGTPKGNVLEQNTEEGRAPAAPKPIENKEAEKMTSGVFERMKAEHPQLGGDLTYDPIKLKEDAKKAVDLIASNRQKAYDIAMGKETSSEVTSTAVNIALAEKALNDGNYDLYDRLVRNRSLEQTRRGQEIVAEKGSVTDNSTSRYIKELISSRLDILGKKYLSDLGNKLKSTTTKESATKIIDAEVSKLETKIKEKKMDTKTALSLLEELTCV